MLAIITAPVLAIGVAMGGLVLPANAADTTTGTDTSTTQPTDAATPSTDSSNVAVNGCGEPVGQCVSNR